VRVGLIGHLDHVLERVEVRPTLFSVAPVFGREFPLFQGIALAVLEALQLLLVREVQPELDERDVIINEQSLELTISWPERLAVSLSMRPSTRSTRRRPYHERSKTVMPPVRRCRLETPKEHVSEFFSRRSTDRHDANVTRVDTGGQAANRTALASSVETFEQNHEPRGNDLRVEKTGREEAELRQAVLGRRHPFYGLGFVHRQ